MTEKKGRMIRHKCQYCIGALQSDDSSVKHCVKTTAQEGQICTITHMPMRDSELENGCEYWHDLLWPAFFVDVMSRVEYCTRHGDVLSSEDCLDTIIRIHDAPNMPHEWHDVYDEALQIRASEMDLPIGIGAAWKGNVFTCIPRHIIDHGKDAMRQIRVVFSAKVRDYKGEAYT